MMVGVEKAVVSAVILVISKLRSCLSFKLLPASPRAAILVLSVRLILVVPVLRVEKSKFTRLPLPVWGREGEPRRVIKVLPELLSI